MQVFDALPLAALLNSKVFLCHGGISPYLHRPQDVNAIRRPLVSSWEESRQGMQEGSFPSLLSSAPCLGSDVLHSAVTPGPSCSPRLAHRM